MLGPAQLLLQCGVPGVPPVGDVQELDRLWKESPFLQDGAKLGLTMGMQGLFCLFVLFSFEHGN